MIKLLAIDLDGVCADIKDTHYKALNEAIEEIVGIEYQISYEEHIKEYDGLPTYKKLEKLTEKKGMPARWSEIQDLKQKKTQELLKTIEFNPKLFAALAELSSKNKYKIYCCSNSIRETIIIVLERLKIFDFFDGILSNEEVNFPKPSASIYLKAMLEENVGPNETLIFEDSVYGIMAGQNAKANVKIVKNSKDMTNEFISKAIQDSEINQLEYIYENHNLNIIIPLAGAGKRFQEAGYKLPKPLIDINGYPMIYRVIDSLKIKGNYIFLAQEEHIEKFNLGVILKLIGGPNTIVVPVCGLTSGAATTIKLALPYLKGRIENSLIIANSDQLLKNWNPLDFFYKMHSTNADGGILTFGPTTDSKWSYVKEKDGWINEVAEKRPISDKATIGVYFWEKAKDCFNSIDDMMLEESNKVNSEWYLAPSFNKLISKNKKIKAYDAGIIPLGDPESLRLYLDEQKNSNKT